MVTSATERALGDVWWFEPPNSTRRPYVILTRTAAIPYLNRLTAAPLTRTIRDIPTEVPLEASDGVPVECVIQLDNITRLPSAYLTEHITKLGTDRMAQVCRAARIAIDC